MSGIWIFLLIQFGLILIGAISWVIFNLLRKLEKAEVLVKKQDEYLLNLYELIMMSKKRIEEIDANQIFQSDDEIGFFFTNIKNIQAELSDYIKFIK